ncbi:MAG TPA: hypothetical protein VNW29_02705 [Candidatus Sulfotelmatobacter sp.]|nr:hypothetical protein [Candidatus Sulfotelmatobacter sp.]
MKGFVDTFKQQPGNDYILGIREDGLVLAVRRECTNDPYSDGFFEAWVLDANRPPGEIVENEIRATFSRMNIEVSRDGGTAQFPSFLSENPVLAQAFSLSPTERRIIENPKKDSKVAVLKATGGFFVPSKIKHPQGLPHAGGQTLYPLPF